MTHPACAIELHLSKGPLASSSEGDVQGTALRTLPLDIAGMGIYMFKLFLGVRHGPERPFDSSNRKLIGSLAIIPRTHSR
jgi:hypothetical protein